MKCLLLLRHAKSSWDDLTLEDWQRPLAPRGRQAAPRMGREIALRGWRPQRVLVSPARRAQETWNLVAPELPDRPEGVETPQLYGASQDAVLRRLRHLPEDLSCVLLVGHNPQLESLAHSLAGRGSDAQALAQIQAKFPTAALAVLAFDAPWRRLARRGARLTHCLKVKALDREA